MTAVTQHAQSQESLKQFTPAPDNPDSEKKHT